MLVLLLVPRLPCNFPNWASFPEAISSHHTLLVNMTGFIFSIYFIWYTTWYIFSDVRLNRNDQYISNLFPSHLQLGKFPQSNQLPPHACFKYERIYISDIFLCIVNMIYHKNIFDSVYNMIYKEALTANSK